MTCTSAFPALTRAGLGAFLTMAVAGCVSVGSSAQYCPIPSAGSRPVASEAQATTPAASR